MEPVIMVADFDAQVDRTKPGWKWPQKPMHVNPLVAHLFRVLPERTIHGEDRIDYLHNAEGLSSGDYWVHISDQMPRYALGWASYTRSNRLRGSLPMRLYARAAINVASDALSWASPVMFGPLYTALDAARHYLQSPSPKTLSALRMLSKRALDQFVAAPMRVTDRPGGQAYPATFWFVAKSVCAACFSAARAGAPHFDTELKSISDEEYGYYADHYRILPGEDERAILGAAEWAGDALDYAILSFDDDSLESILGRIKEIILKNLSLPWREGLPDFAEPVWDFRFEEGLDSTPVTALVPPQVLLQPAPASRLLNRPGCTGWA